MTQIDKCERDKKSERNFRHKETLENNKRTCYPEQRRGKSKSLADAHSKVSINQETANRCKNTVQEFPAMITRFTTYASNVVDGKITIIPPLSICARHKSGIEAVNHFILQYEWPQSKNTEEAKNSHNRYNYIRAELRPD